MVFDESTFAVGFVPSVLWIGSVALVYWLTFLGCQPLLFRFIPVLRKKSRKEQLSAFVRIPSTLNCLVVCSLGAFNLLFDEALSQDRVFGHSMGGRITAVVAAGYFVFDLTHSLYDYQGFAFLLHAVLCTAVFSGALRPFVQYYACVYLLFETSTFFLNLIWFVK